MWRGPLLTSTRRMSQSGGGPIYNRISNKLQESLCPLHLEIINESYMHNVPKNSETHFKVVVVSEKFENVKLIGRHRLVNDTLKQELSEGVHALSINAYTPEQWGEGKGVERSPACKGGFGK
ncbi:bolA-like protein DDB_G0274169 [Eurytemora carolleeae]|uniref:bolA-like protein DDB_G0274169 n=1 Tax=Eurytemora carolleeae TaxID=1294199 RepID=UPI000C79026D|nr:bolA-like protein DDB_G0274169 [Eurytemora carolleeae]|eukprot:XP_023339170.1 bolA-like protein DDB_G0274169 [Eurytemora affinis]